MMLFGDNTWVEFYSIVCKIFIYTLEDVEKMTPQGCSAEQPITRETSKHYVSDLQESTLPATNVDV